MLHQKVFITALKDVSVKVQYRLQIRLRINSLIFDMQLVHLSEHCMLGGGALDKEATEFESLLLRRLLLLL